MRRYVPLTSAIRRHGNYSVALLYSPSVYRPNKLAAGMALTADRHCTVQAPTNPDALRLSVFGTLDSLCGLGLMAIRLPCQCCGSKRGDRLALSQMGKARLARLRARSGEPPRT